MTTNELKILLDNPNNSVIFGIKDCNLMLKVEDLLLNNGYCWRYREKNFHFIRDEFLNMVEDRYISLNINYHEDEDKILSILLHSKNVPIEEICDMIITDDTLKNLQQCFNQIPDYTPKKITREI